MDKKIYKYAAIIILLLLFSVDGYYIYQHGVDLGLEKPALILKVSTNLTDKGSLMVNNVTFEQSSVPFFYKTTDTAPDFPEIDVDARINTLDSPLQASGRRYITRVKTYIPSRYSSDQAASQRRAIY